MGLSKHNMIVMLEDTVSEQRDLKMANEQKTNKYTSDEIKNMVRQRYRVQQVTKAAVTISIREIWSIRRVQASGTSMLRRRRGEG